MNTYRELINIIDLFEDRLPNVEYQDSAEKVIAVLKSYNSQVYTKLAQKIERIDALEKEIKELKESVKKETKENIADLFDADDIVKTRVIQTLSFLFTMSKDPKVTESPKYKEILEALSKQLTPQLILVLEQLKTQMVTRTQKSPSLKITSMTEHANGRITESIMGNALSKFKRVIIGWASRYDRALSELKRKV